MITRHVWWERSKERIDYHRRLQRGKAIYQHRKETVERSFADAKELHGHRYARMRGLSKVQEQSLLCAICQNIKKIALLTGGSVKSRLFSLLKSPFSDRSTGALSAPGATHTVVRDPNRSATPDPQKQTPPEKTGFVSSLSL